MLSHIHWKYYNEFFVLFLYLLIMNNLPPWETDSTLEERDTDFEDTDTEHTIDEDEYMEWILDKKYWDELWSPVFGYEGLYEVSSYGRIKRISRKDPLWRRISSKMLIPQINSWWYLAVGLSKNNVRNTKKIHRIVAKAFIPNYENKPEINHKNWIKTDNTIDNLEWVTPSENMLHKYRVLGYTTSEKTRETARKNWIITQKRLTELKKKKVYQFDFNKKLIWSFESTRDAERKTWTHQASISRCCLWAWKYANWFLWRYTMDDNSDDYESLEARLSPLLNN